MSFFSPSLSLRASKECQNKERLVEQRFRAALRDFQQWLVNAKISTAKCFDVPQSVAEASTALQRIQARHLFNLALIYHEHILNLWYVLKTVVAKYLQSLPWWSLLISHETHVFFWPSFPFFAYCCPVHQTVSPGQMHQTQNSKYFGLNYILSYYSRTERRRIEFFFWMSQKNPAYWEGAPFLITCFGFRINNNAYSYAYVWALSFRTAISSWHCWPLTPSSEVQVILEQ